MARSLKKGPYVDAKLLRRVENMNESGKKIVIKSWARACSITPEMVGHTIAIHNGRIHVPVYISDNMIGHSSVSLRLPVSSADTPDRNAPQR